LGHVPSKTGFLAVVMSLLYSIVSCFARGGTCFLMIGDQQNDRIQPPVLKHGPRSRLRMQVKGQMNPLGVTKVNALLCDPQCKERRSTTQCLLNRGQLNCSIRARTRKVVNYTHLGRRQSNLCWKSEMVLTCKSFIRDAYSGERLIELPSSWFPPKFPQES